MVKGRKEAFRGQIAKVTKLKKKKSIKGTCSGDVKDYGQFK